MKRRQMLRLTGTGFVVALPGCSGSDSGNGSGDPETDSQGSTQTPTAASTEDQETTETDTEDTTSASESSEEGYPTQANSGRFEKIMEGRAEEWEGFYCFKIDDYEYINTGSIDAGTHEPGERYPFDVALATAANMEYNGEGSDTLFFWVNPTDDDGENPAEPKPGRINMYVNSGDWEQSNLEGKVVGHPDELRGDNVDPEAVQDAYTEFFSEHIDGDGIIDHAGDIPEYARNALESGWQAE
jgi:hypothetical protein